MSKIDDKDKTKAQLIWELKSLRKALADATTNQDQESSQFKKVLQVVNSTLSLDDVMEKVMEALSDVINFNQLSIYLFNSDNNTLEATNWYGENVSDELMEQFVEFPLSIEWDDVYFIKAFLDNEICYVSPITPELLKHYSERDRKMFELNPHKSIAIFPLEVQGKVIGIINFAHTDIPFTLDKQKINQIAGYVSQIAATINNAYLVRKSRFAIEEAQNKEKEITHLNNIISTSNETLDFDAVFGAILDGLRETFEFSAIGIQLVDEENELLNIYKVYGDIIRPEQVEKWRNIEITSSTKTSVSSFVFNTGETAYFHNIEPEMPFSDIDRKIYNIEPFRTYLAYPLNVQGKRIGVISFFCVDDTPVLSKRDLAKIERYLLSVSNTINNANNYLQLKRSNDIFASLLDASSAMRGINDVNDILRFTLAKLKQLFPYLSLGAMLHGNRPGIIEYAAFEGILAHEQEWLFTHTNELLTEVEPERLSQTLSDAVSSSDSQNNEWSIFPINGLSGKVKGNLIAKGQMLGTEERKIIKVFLEQVTNVAENALLSLQIEKLANTDVLTSTFNRFHFDQIFTQMSETHNRLKFVEFSLILVEVIGIDGVNDKYGMLSGDDLIKKTSELLQKTSRKSDIICRISGSKFAILCPNTRIEAAHNLITRIIGNSSQYHISIKLGENKITNLGVQLALGAAATNICCTDNLMDVALAELNGSDASSTHQERDTQSN